MAGSLRDHRAGRVAGASAALSTTLLAASVSLAAPHPMSPEACALPGAADGAAQAWAGGGSGPPPWPDPLPASGPEPVLRQSQDGTLLLLASEHVIAMLSSPDRKGGGRLVWLGDRRFGGNLIRPGRGSAAGGWEVCRGEGDTQPSRCAPRAATQRAGASTGAWSREVVEGVPGVTMLWKEAGGATVSTHYQIRNGSLRARIRVEDQGGDEKGIVHVRFPLLDAAGQAGGERMRLVLPRFNLGIVCDDCPGANELYPRHFQSMPWFGYLEGDHGLYVGAHDPEGRVKRVRAAGPAKPGASYFELYPESSGTPGNTLDMDWWVEIAPVCADRGWPTLTYLYRRWVTSSTPWGRAPLLSDRERPGPEFREGAWWFNHSSRDTDPITKLERRTIEARRSIRTGITAHHWYGWHVGGMDRGFPVFDPKPGTAAAVARVQREGAWVFPYTNGGHTDQSKAPASTGRPNGCDARYSRYPLLWEGAVRRPNGRPWFAKPSSGACLVRMSPAHRPWRATVREVAHSVTERLGSRGLYFDVLGNAFPGSWDSQGHAPGIGSWLARSERSLLAEARPADRIVAVEGALEQMIGVADVNLHYLATPTTMAPLFMAVYHDRALVAGIRSKRPDDHVALAMKMGLATVWGLQPGLVNLQPNEFHAAGNAAFANHLLLARQRLRDWLVYGEFISPIEPDPSGESTPLSTRSWCDYRDHCGRFTRPAIEATWYRSADGTDRIVLVNMSERPARLVARVPKALASRALILREADGSRVGPAKRSKDGLEVTLESPGRLVRYVVPEAATP